MLTHSPRKIRKFFAQSEWLDRACLRPLDHIAPNWETIWDDEVRRYVPEYGSFAADLNAVIEQIATSVRPRRYHDHEDRLVERQVRRSNWPIQKRGHRWVGADYAAILEQGAFGDIAQMDLILAAAGRVHAALDHRQIHFDKMEEAHCHMLSAIISIIIYHRCCDGSSLLVEE
tara:strand:+ start:20117 stop:20635 length:519 start_codon:yes stop_codon:yes gene_type:complete